MIRINQIKIPVEKNLQDHKKILKNKASKILRIDVNFIKEVIIRKKSIDARKKHEIFYVYTADFLIENENRIRFKGNDISIVNSKDYIFPYSNTSETIDRPIIIGLGPAGLFCGYILAKAGFKPIIFERGKRIEERTEDVAKFWKTGILDPESNVQFGEGGAGAFSDGKLATLIKDKNGRNKEVLKTFVDFGADEDILYDNKPHIGTDKLVKVVAGIRDAIIKYGGEIHYGSKVDSFEIKNQRIEAIYCNGKRIDARRVILAPGHSARDTFTVLSNQKVPMEPKAFSVGFRVMHPQSIIDNNQYGEDYMKYSLPVSSYKLTSIQNGRGVYSFCMCPGGYVVNASSESGMVAVNGMSYHDRGSGIANSAIVVQVSPADFESDDILSGIAFQRKLEKKAFDIAKGKIPVQKYGDFKKSVIQTDDCEYILDFTPACRGDYEYCELSGIMPQELNVCFINGMEDFGRRIKHFNDGNVILAGIESRTSSPVRIVRNDKGMSDIVGLYPCGEGAGYAGGITSAAMDGIFIAEMVASNILNKD